jgi:hypothetical protein
MVEHACNPSCLGNGNWDDHGSRPAQAKSQLALSQSVRLVWWQMPVTQATFETYIGGFQSMSASPG